MQRRVSKWFERAFASAPPEVSREELIGIVFGQYGWVTLARISDTTGPRPMHGHLLLHPEWGYVAYADKPRNGDLGPRYLAPQPVGAWNRSRLVWAQDLTDLLLSSPTPPETTPNPFPHHRVVFNLAAYAYLNAPPAEQAATQVLLGLNGYPSDLVRLDLSVTSAELSPSLLP